jgi:hypothetical protein
MQMSEIKQDQLRVKGSDCPVALACYAYVWQARPNQDPTKPAKYALTLVWDKSVDLSKFKAAASAAARKKWGDKVPPMLKSPFRDGDAYFAADPANRDPLFKGKVFIVARSKDKPAVVDRTKQPIVNEMDFYSGCQCKAALSAFAYENSGNNGVSFALGPIQKVADGQRLAGQRDPDEEFNEEGDAQSGGSAPINDLF